MSTEPFDELTKSLATSRSRRAGLKGVLGWAVKGVAVAVGVSAAGALRAPGAEAGKACDSHCDCPKNQVCGNPILRCVKVLSGSTEKVCKLQNNLEPSPIGWTYILREATCLSACS
jgi:hypothetical protein